MSALAVVIISIIFSRPPILSTTLGWVSLTSVASSPDTKAWRVSSAFSLIRSSRLSPEGRTPATRSTARAGSRPRESTSFIGSPEFWSDHCCRGTPIMAGNTRIDKSAGEPFDPGAHGDSRATYPYRNSGRNVNEEIAEPKYTLKESRFLGKKQSQTFSLPCERRFSS